MQQTCASNVVAVFKHLHQSFDVHNLVLLQSGDHNVALSVLAWMQFLALVEQIVQVSLVDLVESNVGCKMSILRLAKHYKNVPRCQHIKTYCESALATYISHPSCSIAMAIRATTP